MPPTPARRPSGHRPVDLPPAPDQRRYVLTPQESRFVEEYLVDLDPRQAAARANFAPERGKALLARPKVQDAIAVARRRRLSRLQLYGDEIVRRWAALASADPNEVVELRRVNCRHCHGRDHEPRWDDVEYRAVLRAHNAALDAYDAARSRRPSNARDQIAPSGDPPPVLDERGGPGFRVNDAPHPACPKCGGDGIIRVVIRDSRFLSAAGRLLYDGVKVAPGGAVEVKLRDRSWAEQQLARHAGLFNERAPVDEFDPTRMSDDQLDAVLHSMVERGVVELDARPDEYRVADPKEPSDEDR